MKGDQVKEVFILILCLYYKVGSVKKKNAPVLKNHINLN